MAKYNEKQSGVGKYRLGVRHRRREGLALHPVVGREPTDHGKSLSFCRRPRRICGVGAMTIRNG